MKSEENGGTFRSSPKQEQNSFDPLFIFSFKCQRSRFRLYPASHSSSHSLAPTPSFVFFIFQVAQFVEYRYPEMPWTYFYKNVGRLDVFKLSVSNKISH